MSLEFYVIMIEEGVIIMYREFKKVLIKIANVIKYILRKYWKDILILTIVSLIVRYNILNNEAIEIVAYDGFDFIFILLPTVLTIVSITLSLQKETIYGVEQNKFRKLSKHRKYNFMDMIIISIVIMCAYVTFDYYGLTISIFLAMGISVFYTIVFIMQEIPLLLRNERYIERIIKKAVHETELSESLKNVLHYMLFTKGLEKTYNALKVKNDPALLILLLTEQNEFLFRYKNSYSIASSKFMDSNNLYNIVDVIKWSTINTSKIFDSTEILNYASIVGSSEHYYQVTRTLFALHNILDVNLKLEDMYIHSISQILRPLFWTIDGNNKDIKEFSNKVLTSMMVSTLSANELWFVKFLRNHFYNHSTIYSGSSQMFIFISIYLYYLCEIEKSVSPKFATEIKSFIQNTPLINSHNEHVDSWEEHFKHVVGYGNVNDAGNLLIDLIKIFECRERFNWYDVPFGKVRTSSLSDEFTKALIINWWIGYLMVSDGIHTDKDNILMSCLNKLNDEDKVIFSEEMNKNWTENEILVENPNITWFEFYNFASMIPKYKKDSDIFSVLLEFKNKELKDREFENITKNALNQTAFERIKEELKVGFNRAVESIPFTDHEINIDEEPQKAYTFLSDSKYSETIINQYIEQMPHSLGRLIRDEFEKSDIQGSMLENNTHTIETLTEIIRFSPTLKSSRIYRYTNDLELDSLIDKVNKVKTIIDIYMPRNLFIKENGISVNFRFNNDLSSVRELSPEEIEQIIDRDYKMTNGYYMYVDGVDDVRSFPITRKELGEILKEKLFFAQIVFAFKVEFNKENIKYYIES